MHILYTYDKCILIPVLDHFNDKKAIKTTYRSVWKQDKRIPISHTNRPKGPEDMQTDVSSVTFTIAMHEQTQ